MSKYRENINAEYRDRQQQPKELSAISKDLHKEFQSLERDDSGFGSMTSYEDRSATGSYSLSDESRDQVCIKEDNFDSSELAQETRKITLSDNDHDSNYFSLDSRDGKSNNSSAKIETKPSFINSYAQTNDIRYLLAPFWRSLLLPNEDGDTSLHLAIIYCQEPVIDAIINVLPQKEFYLNIYNDLVQTPLHLAVVTRQSHIVEKLLNNGASLDVPDRNGQTCLHLACQRGDMKVIKAIFKVGLKNRHYQEKIQEVLQTRNFNGKTPLHIAVLENNLEVVKLLVSLGADVNDTDRKSGQTALHLAVEQNNLPMVSYLLFEGNAYVDAASYSDCTPLHLAAGLGFNTVLATLIAAGANQTLENSEGETAFEVACDDVSDILECTFEPMEDWNTRSNST